MVWREKELVVERILIDNEFLSVALEKATNFFVYGVLPELLGKWYSKLPHYVIQSSGDTDSESPEAAASQENSPEVWCFCRAEESGQMIACDNEQCKIIWFHTSCLRIEKIPKGKWLCPDCHSKGKKRKSRIEKDDKH